MPDHVRDIAYPRLLFSEVQRFRKPVGWILAALIGGVPAILIIWAKAKNPQFHIIFVLGVLAVCMIFPALVTFVGLRVVVTSEQISIDFFPIRRKIIRISEIESAKAETYHPIKEFGGWGWRGSLRDSTWAYTMSGDRGVRMLLRNGTKIMLGSQRADELEEAITNAMGVIRPTAPAGSPA